MHMTYAHAPHERTSLVTPRWAAEMLVAAVAAWRARPRPRAIEPWPSLAKAATIKRPVRVGEGSGQRAVVRWLGRRGAEFESWGRRRTFARREESALVEDDGGGALGGGCPGKFPDNCHLSSH